MREDRATRSSSGVAAGWPLATRLRLQDLQTHVWL